MPITKYSPQFRAELLKKFEEYIDNTDCPYTQTFIIDSNIPAGSFYEFDEFSDLCKKVQMKREMYFVDRLIQSKGNCVVYMFLLKCQHNYRETTPIQIETGRNKYVQINLTDKSIEELQDLATKQLRQVKASRVSKARK